MRKSILIALAVLLVLLPACTCRVIDGKFVVSDECFGNVLPCADSTHTVGAVGNGVDVEIGVAVEVGVGVHVGVLVGVLVGVSVGSGAASGPNWNSHQPPTISPPSKSKPSGTPANSATLGSQLTCLPVRAALIARAEAWRSLGSSCTALSMVSEVCVDTLRLICRAGGKTKG